MDKKSLERGKKTDQKLFHLHSNKHIQHHLTGSIHPERVFLKKRKNKERFNDIKNPSFTCGLGCEQMKCVL